MQSSNLKLLRNNIITGHVVYRANLREPRKSCYQNDSSYCHCVSYRQLTHFSIIREVCFAKAGISMKRNYWTFCFLRNALVGNPI